MPVAQPAEALEAVGAALAASTIRRRWRRSSVITTLTGSALLALAVAAGG